MTGVFLKERMTDQPRMKPRGRTARTIEGHRRGKIKRPGKTPLMPNPSASEHPQFWHAVSEQRPLAIIRY